MRVASPSGHTEERSDTRQVIDDFALDPNRIFISKKREHVINKAMM